MNISEDIGSDGKLCKDFFVHLAEVNPILSSVAAEFLGAADGLDPSVVERTLNTLTLANEERATVFARDVPHWHPLYWDLQVGSKHGTFTFPAAPAVDTQFQVMSPMAFLLAVQEQHPTDGDLVTVHIVMNGGESTRTFTWPAQLSTLTALQEAVTLDLDVFLARPSSSQGMSMRRLGRFGKVGHAVETGPPAWLLPRVRIRADRRGISVQAGWRLTAHTVHWFTPEWVRGRGK